MRIYQGTEVYRRGITGGKTEGLSECVGPATPPYYRALFNAVNRALGLPPEAGPEDAIF